MAYNSDNVMESSKVLEPKVWYGRGIRVQLKGCGNEHAGRTVD
jgi:hypothetical protein